MKMLLKKIESPGLLPCELFSAFGRRKFAFLLESGEPHGSISSFSFAGTNPFLTVRAKGNRVVIANMEGAVSKMKGDPIGILRKLVKKYEFKRGKNGIPFAGGAVGYFGYNLNAVIESKVVPCRDDTPSLPDLYFMFCDSGAVFDHSSDMLYLFSIPAVSTMRAEEGMSFLEEAYKKGKRAKMAREGGPPANRRKCGKTKICGITSEKEYCKSVVSVKDYIASGDVYEVNLSHRITIESSRKPFDIYRDLRKYDPTPFSGFLKFEGLSIVSASPERFLRVDGDNVETRPIKGTMPRGKTGAQDKRNRRKLAASIKDKAENIMIVDLSRNDLGRVCETGSVLPFELMSIEAYSRVFQMVSTVRGKLKKGKDFFDCIRACFPAGSMTGAPKIRAMQIIEELEPVRRGIYSGSAGYISFSGDADFNIIIRTLIHWKGKYYLQAGGAVVADSDPKSEYRETLYKAQSIIEALER